MKASRTYVLLEVRFAMSIPSSLSEVFQRKLIFVSGKGGVGKTVVSIALAKRLAQFSRRTLWVTFEDPTRPAGELKQVQPNLWFFNCDASQAFDEYMGMKIGVAGLTRLFVNNKLVKYLAKAAPGIHELVLLGKIWHESNHYDHVVVDMPSTGYGLAMFQSTENFSRLFSGGPLFKDAAAMLETFRDPRQTGLLIVALPEEMPLQESLELDQFLQELFPKNRAAFVVNRCFPTITDAKEEEKSPPESWPTPFATDGLDYARKRSILEKYNLRIWESAGIRFDRFDYLAPKGDPSLEEIAEELSRRLALEPKKGGGH